MPTIISHPAILLATRPFFRLPLRTYVIGGMCSILPDIDVIGFRFGVKYGDVLGHRGLTHSIFFSVIVSFLLTRLILKKDSETQGRAILVFFFLFCCTVSHGIFDAFTDGGLGVAFF